MRLFVSSVADWEGVRYTSVSYRKMFHRSKIMCEVGLHYDTRIDNVSYGACTQAVRSSGTVVSDYESDVFCDVCLTGGW